jgi:hypothetical protein
VPKGYGLSFGLGDNATPEGCASHRRLRARALRGRGLEQIRFALDGDNLGAVCHSGSQDHGINSSSVFCGKPFIERFQSYQKVLNLKNMKT